MSISPLWAKSVTKKLYTEPPPKLLLPLVSTPCERDALVNDSEEHLMPDPLVPTLPQAISVHVTSHHLTLGTLPSMCQLPPLHLVMLNHDCIVRTSCRFFFFSRHAFQSLAYSIEFIVIAVMVAQLSGSFFYSKLLSYR